MTVAEGSFGVSGVRVHWEGCDVSTSDAGQCNGGEPGCFDLTLYDTDDESCLGSVARTIKGIDADGSCIAYQSKPDERPLFMKAACGASGTSPTQRSAA